MLFNYLKTLVRSFRRHPLLSTLNVLGLSIGIGSFLVITLYLFQENSYEKGFADSDRIYRIEEQFLSMGDVASTSTNLPFALQNIAQVARQTRVGYMGEETKLIVDGIHHTIKRMFAGDSTFFRLFDYEFVVGNASEALTQPNQSVLNQETAIQLFGTTDVVGRTVNSPDFGPLTVVGVIKTKVLKSHLDFGLMITQQSGEYKPNAWFGIGGYSYVKLSKGVSEADFQTQLDEFTEKDVYPVIHPSQTIPFEEWIESPNKVRFVSKPVRDIYLSSKAQFEIGVNGDRQTRVTLSIIALFILLVASINFMNLTTAKSSQRTKEIGVRKVLGASKARLIRYFLGETLMITFIATLLGAGMSELFLRLINQSLNGVISISLMNHPILILYLIIFVFLLGILSGIYPAFFLASTNMIALLKGLKLTRVLNLDADKLLRNGLVVMQFTISSTLIIASIIVYKQLQHLSSMDLGFEKDQVVVVEHMFPLKESKYAFRNELLRLPEVSQASFTHRLPADGRSATTSTMLDSETTFTLSHFMTDEYLEETLNLKLIAGEWFDPEKTKYDSVIVINNAAAQALGYEDPIGKVFGKYWTILGVVEDFYFEGLREEIGPAMFMYTPERHNNLAIRFNTDLISIEEIEKVWSKFSANPFEYYYLDQNFEGQLAMEKQNANAVLIFTALAIFISCLGLFGLAAFTADQRLHEFGIRKVLGAKVRDIIQLFGYDFIKLIVLAFIISIPLSFYGIDLWLQGFANRTSISIWPFVLAGVLAIGIAMLTILFQSVKTGRLNPTDTLRNE